MLIIGKKLSPYALLSISGLLAASDQAVKWLAKDKNREGRGYSFEVMRARMLYTTKHKKKAPTAKVSPFYKKPSVTDCRTSQRNSTTESIYQPSEGGIRLMG